MADTGALQVELVAADRTVWSGEASMVIARTVEGDIGILRGHTPLLSLLTDAVVEIVGEGNEKIVAAVDGGFVSVADDRVSILSPRALLAEEIDESAVRADLDRARTGEDGDEAVRQAEARLQAVERSR